MTGRANAGHRSATVTLDRIPICILCVLIIIQPRYRKYARIESGQVGVLSEDGVRYMPTSQLGIDCIY